MRDVGINPIWTVAYHESSNEHAKKYVQTVNHGLECNSNKNKRLEKGCLVEKECLTS